MKLLPSQNYVQGRWRNGKGISWEIATDPQGSGDTGFQWRMAIAQIDECVAFSDYPNVDRIFTLLEGQGLDLILENRDRLHVAKRFVPHAFPGDVETKCSLHSGTCRALNVFFDRGRLKATAVVSEIIGPRMILAENAMMLFALRGTFLLDGSARMNCGDALRFEAGDNVELSPEEGEPLLYIASFNPL
jgi:uncharacterized protein